ncbi:MAG: hypothetical protein ACPG77_19995, partial [Nannocystaceae bacterium]
MTWKVDASEWLEDFTSVARANPRANSFDQTDDRVRRALGDDPAATPAPKSEPAAASPAPGPKLVIPAMVASGAGTSSASGTIPNLTQSRSREPSAPVAKQGARKASGQVPQIPPMTRAAAKKQ